MKELKLSDEELKLIKFKHVFLTADDINTYNLIDWKGHCEVPSYVTHIGEKAFQNNNELKTIKLPDNLRSIGDCAFDGCTNLKTVIFNEIPESIESTAFDNCSNLKYIYVVGDGKKKKKRLKLNLIKIYTIKFASSHKKNQSLRVTQRN